ncbi:molybdopterin cofactor-binding domain-containing protein, partial [Roseateles sp. GG27B]
MKRRTLLLTGLGTAGGLLVGWGLLPSRSRLGSASSLARLDGEVGLNGWIKIAADGAVLLVMNRSEMGQGVHTALAQLVAEELEVPLAQVRLMAAGPEALYGNVAMFLGNLPLHPRTAEVGPGSYGARLGIWTV